MGSRTMGIEPLGNPTMEDLKFRTENLTATSFTRFFRYFIFLFTFIIPQKNDY